MALGVVSGSDITYAIYPQNVHRTWSTYWSRSIHSFVVDVVCPKRPSHCLSVAHKKTHALISCPRRTSGFVSCNKNCAQNHTDARHRHTQDRHSNQMENYQKFASKTKEGLNKMKRKNNTFNMLCVDQSF